MQSIAEIGTDRLINVLVKDKNINPQKTLSILKSEITAILERKFYNNSMRKWYRVYLLCAIFAIFVVTYSE